MQRGHTAINCSAMDSVRPTATNEVRFRSLFDNSPDLVLYQNEEGTILDANPAFLALVEQSRPQVLHRSYDEFLPPNVRDFFRAKLREAFATGQPVRFDLFASQGGSAPRHWDVVKIPLVENGRVVGVHMMARDITEKTTAQQLITQQAAELHMVLESITDAFLSMDQEEKLSYINSEGERLLNLCHKEALGKSIWDILPQGAGDIYRQKYQEALATGQKVRFEAYFEREKRWFEWKVYPFATGVSIFFADITPRKPSTGWKARWS